MTANDIAKFLGISDNRVEQALMDKVLVEPRTIKQAKEAFNSSANGSEAERLVVEKWISLCTTFEQAFEVYDYILSCPTDIRCLNVDSIIRFCTISNHFEMIFMRTSTGSVTERLVMERWLAFCTTKEQVAESYKVAVLDSEAERLTLRRMAEL
ncbi:MAG: hypothetical protein WCQ00_04090 [bacterium]